ncbi:ABC transporter substrate-binding protein [Caproicibacter fermentans]|uniref:Sugar ABC transporter substrate-binding protein n=1 Tax=Caproicibacter fermentans TaxID=2576756 RepID=A0A7G8TDR0_9FIRM|nr:sugar ABC transporter substrate-binding protein [Caproicibacter fermentans]QNK41751.1 sugar ABC transporter substrate-binding protein [Caproicibacter fermentans]
MKKIWRKITAVFITAAIAAGSISGCASSTGGASTGSTTSGQSTEKAKLTVSTWAGADELKQMQAIVDKLNANSKDYTLTIQSIPANYYTKIQAMISAKQAPDLMWLSQEYIPMYAKLGVLMDITDKATQDSKVNLNNYFDGPLNTAKYKDKLYGLPWISQPVVMYYNEGLLKSAGVDLPSGNWSWEDFRTAAKKLTKVDSSGKITQWGTVIDGWPPVQTWIWAYGGETVDKDGKILIDSRESIKGLTELNKILRDNVSPTQEQAQNMGDADLFKTGKVAMFFGGAGDDLEKQVGNKFKVGMAEIPHGDKKVTFSWIASTVISSQTKNPDAAYKALVDLTNATFQWKVVPPIQDGFDMIPKNMPEKEYALDVIKKSSQYARGFNNQEKETEIDTAIGDELYTPLINGKKTPEQAAKDAAAKIKTITGK